MIPTKANAARRASSLFWQADVSDREAVADMFAGAVERFDRIDGKTKLSSLLRHRPELHIQVQQLTQPANDGKS